MKKLFLLFISLAVLTSCSDDDEATPDDGTKILGKWFLVDAQAGSVTNTLNDCNQTSFVDFKADGSAESEFYEEVDGSCELESESSGTWEYLGNSNYSFEIAGYGTSSGTVNFTSNSRFTYTSPEFSPIVLVFEK